MPLCCSEGGGDPARELPGRVFNPAREEFGLLAKCANPPCAALFRYLREGTLFRFQSETLQGIPSAGESEYFWLCPNCAKNMIVRLDATSKIRLVRQQHDHSAIAGSTSF